MEPLKLTLTYASALDGLMPLNASFDKGVLRICYVGQNRNGSFIAKDVFEQCIWSMFNCPIVCNYDVEADEIGAHDIELVHTDSGDIRIINVTTPVGVVPESANYWWETIEDDSGTHEYLCADVLIWKRQAAYEHIKEDGITDQSMEIAVKGGHLEDGVFIITSFEFTAFCLLGSAEPCYESASLSFSAGNTDTYSQRLSEMMQEFKENIETIQHAFAAGQPTKGGEGPLDEKLELLKQFGLSTDTLDFDLESYTLEELKAKLEEDANKFSLTAQQFMEELSGALGEETVETDWGTMRRYWYVDHDTAAGEVYCWDTANGWRLYGLTYTMDGDSIVIDFENPKRKKIMYVDFEEGAMDFALQPMIEAVTCAFKEKVVGQEAEKFAKVKSELEQKYAQAAADLDALNAQLEELNQFKLNQEQEKRAADEAAIFAQFDAELGTTEEFQTLKDNCAEMSLDTIEEKCFAMIGRAKKLSFSAQTQKESVRLPVERKSTGTDEPYGTVFAEYGPRT